MKDDQVIKPERLPDGDYLVIFHSWKKSATRWGRQDLVPNFSLKSSKNVVLLAYFQVKGPEDGSFKENPQ